MSSANRQALDITPRHYKWSQVQELYFDRLGAKERRCTAEIKIKGGLEPIEGSIKIGGEICRDGDNGFMIKKGFVTFNFGSGKSPTFPTHLFCITLKPAHRMKVVRAIKAAHAEEEK